MRCESERVPEQTCSFASESGTLTSDGYVLAGESSANKVGSSHKAKAVCPLIRCPNVVVPWHIGPMSCEDLLALGIYLDLADALVPSLLKAQVKAADAGEQTDEFHGAESSPKEDGTGVRHHGVSEK